MRLRAYRVRASAAVRTGFVLAALFACTGVARGQAAPEATDPETERLRGVDIEVFALQGMFSQPEAYVGALVDLIKRHRPGGKGERRDLRAAYLALLSDDLVPQDTGAVLERFRWMLAGDLEARCTWPLLMRLWRIVFSRDRDHESAAVMLRKWLGDLRRLDNKGTRLSLLLDLVDGWLDLATGNTGLAKTRAKGILAVCGDDAEVEISARGLRDRCDMLGVGITAPKFRLTLAGSEGEVALAALEGRGVLVCFDRNDREAQILWKIAEHLFKELPPLDLAAVWIPVSEPPRGDSPAKPGPTPPLNRRWLRVAASPANLELAREYGIRGISGAFLVTPEGTILGNFGYRHRRTTSQFVTKLKQTAGMSVRAILELTRPSNGWRGFRRAYRLLAVRKRLLASPSLMQEAKQIGSRAVYAAMVAAAVNGQVLPSPYEGQPGTAHGNLVLAWCAARTGGDDAAWRKIASSLSRSSSKNRLETVDALFDLGLCGDRVLVALRRPARTGKDWRVVSVALRALSHQDTDGRPSGLTKHTKHRKWQVRLALAEALRAYRHPDAVDSLIELLGDQRMRVRAGASESLESLTRRYFGLSRAKWRKWRLEQGASIAFPPREFDVETTLEEAEHDYAVQKYYGLNITSDRLVFLLDKSDSMYYGLFDGVVRETEAFLRSAGPTTQFTVFEFADTPKPWRKDLASANDQSIKAVVQFLHRGKPYGATNINDSLLEALAVEDIDSVILLSDGLPNRGSTTEPEGILDAISRRNRYDRIAIHTVWMCQGRSFAHDGPKPADRPPPNEEEMARRRLLKKNADRHKLGAFLQHLAAANSGTFAMAFEDYNLADPNSNFRDSTDK